MDGRRHEVISTDGTRIGLLTAGAGPDGLRNAPLGYDIMPIVSATLPREALALAGVNLRALAARVASPVLLILGDASPPWAGEITRELTAALPESKVAVLPGQGHLAVDSAPGLVARALTEFFS